MKQIILYHLNFHNENILIKSLFKIHTNIKIKKINSKLFTEYFLQALRFLKDSLFNFQNKIYNKYNLYDHI